MYHAKIKNQEICRQKIQENRQRQIFIQQARSQSYSHQENQETQEEYEEG